MGAKATEVLINGSAAKERFRWFRDIATAAVKRERTVNFQQLVDSVNEIGPRNISSVSRSTGLPIETARYKVNRQLPSAGFRVEAEIDYGKLGLSMNWVELGYSDLNGVHPLEILHDWSTKNYLAYFSKLFSGNRFVALFTSPLDGREEFTKTLDELVEVGVFSTYRADELSFFSYLRPNLAFFNVESKKWLDGWEELTPQSSARPDGLPKLSEPCRVDQIDLSVVRQLQIDPTLSARELASRIGLPYPVVRYHLASHVMKRKMVRRFTVRWHGLGETSSIILEFRELTHDELDRARRTLASLPFKFLEAGAGYGRLYIMQLVSPKDRLASVLNLLKICLGSIISKMELKILSNEETRTYPLPVELFHEVGGWRHRYDEILDEAVPK